MRRKLKRYYGSGDLHFITCSCYQRQPLLGTSQHRDLFLSVLEQMRIRYQFVVAGYVIMPEHIHLLISEPETKNPSTVMQAGHFSKARSGAPPAGLVPRLTRSSYASREKLATRQSLCGALQGWDGREDRGARQASSYPTSLSGPVEDLIDEASRVICSTSSTAA